MSETKRNVPKLRFPGFTEDWEQRKLGEVASLRGGYAFKSGKFLKKGIPVIRISNILSDGIVGGEFAHYYEEEMEENFIVKDKSILIAMSGATTGKVGILHCEENQKFYQNQRVGYFEPNDQWSYKFIGTFVKSKLFEKQLDSVLVAGAQPNISSRDINDFDIWIPNNINEQNQIGVLFESFDNLITLHQRKLENLKLKKKSLLQKLFPKNGEQFPELRFPGFTDAWEQRKLGEILKVNSGKDYKHLENGDIPVYGTGGYMLSVNEALSDIDAIGIGRKGTIDKPQYLKAPFWTVDTLFYLVPLEKYSCSLLYHLSNLIPWKKFDESTGVPSLSKSTIDGIQVNIPKDKKEQDRISMLFDRINNLITLHQRKLEHLQLQKKALLQQMFV